MKEQQEIANAIRDTFSSPNVNDSNLEPANVVDVLDGIARAVITAAKLLGNGDASTPMGAIEAHGKAMLDSAERIADSLDGIAASLADMVDAVRQNP
jgi:hypothetical protein